MSRRVGGAQLAAVAVTAESTAASALDWRREKVELRIDKLEKQVSKLGECVAVEGERLTPRERAVTVEEKPHFAQPASRAPSGRV